MENAESFVENENVKLRAAKLEDRYNKIVELAHHTAEKLKQNAEGNRFYINR